MGDTIREATGADASAIARIWNEGIADRIATLDEDSKSDDDVRAWFDQHGGRYTVLVDRDAVDRIVAWASLNRYSYRCAYDGVADLSIYVERAARGRGIGKRLLQALERHAIRNDFRKIVLFALAQNTAGTALYRSLAYREVGIFRAHGYLDGIPTDVIAMEKPLKPFVLFVCRHNTGRSQMAEAYLRHFAGDAIEVASAGTIAADVPDPGVVAAMAEDGIDIRAARPKLIDPVLAARANRIITMGCDVTGVPNIDADWGLDDPKGAPPETLRAIRDRVKEHARTLAAELIDRN